MTFAARTYDEIVRDMLTTLTGGTVRESLVVPLGTTVMPALRNHPVRRVSHAEGTIVVTVLKQDPRDPSKKIPVDEQRPYRFTDAELELVSTSGDESDKDAIRFREKGRKPLPGSMLTINYYPVHTDPVPLTDVTVGSVVRTLIETFAFELALSYQQLEQVYKSAFVETAQGDALNRVVSLVGITRMPGGHPVARLRFSRQATGGSVTIPAGTPVTDEKGNRYLTVAEALMEPGEATREVTAAGETSSTEEVQANKLKFLEMAIAGISEVTNPEAARRITAAETDEALRVRARGALRAALRGTPDAIRFGLTAIDGVKDVSITEDPARPGVIDINVAYSDDSEAVKKLVADRLEELRPAGIIVHTVDAAKLRVSARVALTLAGSSLPAAQIDAVKSGAASKVEQTLKALPPGGKVRRAQLVSAVLADARIVDAKITLTPEGRDATEELTLEAGQVLEVVSPVAVDPPQFETAPAARGVVSMVSMSLPIHLVRATTEAEAVAAIDAAVTTYLATRAPDAPLTVDGLVGAIRDDTRYAIVRAEVLVTVESEGTFRQLTDGVGSYPPALNEGLEKESIVVDIREGGV